MRAKKRNDCLTALKVNKTIFRAADRKEPYWQGKDSISHSIRGINSRVFTQVGSKKLYL